MTKKENPTTEEKEEKVETEEVKETPEPEPSPCLPDINDIIENVKSCLPGHISINKPKELCEVHIVGTPELILKILKIE